MTTTVEIPARDFDFALNTGTVAVPIWTTVGHINTWSHSPKAKDADTTTFDDNGRDTHMKISRGDEFGLKGLYSEDPANGTRDAGQTACEAWGALVGSASKKQFRITSPGGINKTFMCTATVTIGGGGKDDATDWELALVVAGAITTA